MAVHASVRARRLLAWGQKQSLPKLFDHLIGAGEERRRHFQIKRSRRDRIEDKLKLILLFDRDVSRLGAAQNFIHVIGGAPVAIEKVRPLGHQAPSIGPLALGMPCSQRIGLLCPPAAPILAPEP